MKRETWQQTTKTKEMAIVFYLPDRRVITLESIVSVGNLFIQEKRNGIVELYFDIETVGTTHKALMTTERRTYQTPLLKLTKSVPLEDYWQETPCEEYLLMDKMRERLVKNLRTYHRYKLRGTKYTL